MKPLVWAVAKKYNITRKMYGKNFSDSGVGPKEPKSDKTFAQALSEDADPKNLRTQEGKKDDLKKLAGSKGECFKEVFKHMASMMCLTCDADYATKKISLDATNKDKPTIDLKDSVCATIKEKCFEFINRTVAADKGKQMELMKKIDKAALLIIPTSLTDKNLLAKFIIAEVALFKVQGKGIKLR